MAVVVFQDLIVGTMHEESDDGVHYERPATVTGLDAGNGFDLTAQAIRAPGMPQRGDAHPSRPTATVRRHRVKLESDTVAHVTVIYETPKPSDGQQGGGGANQWRFARRAYEIEEPTQLDVNGVPIQVAYDPPPPTSGPRAGVRETVVKTATVNGGKSVQVLVVTGVTLEPIPEGVFDAQGSTNSQPWKGGEIATWKFGSIEETTNDFGRSFFYELVFEKRKTTWDEFAVFRDENDQIPPDIDKPPSQHPPGQSVAKGVTRAQVRPETDFNALFAFLQGPTGIPGVL